MLASPQASIDAIVAKFGMKLRGSGRVIKCVYNAALGRRGMGSVRLETPDIIEIGPKALAAGEEETATTIAHELNHARDLLRAVPGPSSEAAADAAETGLSEYIQGKR
jgi:hypothetical protein